MQVMEEFPDKMIATVEEARCLVEKCGYTYLDVRPTLELEEVRAAPQDSPSQPGRAAAPAAPSLPSAAARGPGPPAGGGALLGMAERVASVLCRSVPQSGRCQAPGIDGAACLRECGLWCAQTRLQAGLQHRLTAEASSPFAMPWSGPPWAAWPPAGPAASVSAPVVPLLQAQRSFWQATVPVRRGRATMRLCLLRRACLHVRALTAWRAPCSGRPPQAGKYKQCVNIPLYNAKWQFNAATKKREIKKEENELFIQQVCQAGARLAPGSSPRRAWGRWGLRSAERRRRAPF